MNSTRRRLIQRGLGAGALGMAVGAGLLTPQRLLAAWPTKAFEAKSVEGALQDLGQGTPRPGEIDIKAPEIAENGSTVPVSITTGIQNVESISILVANNATPLTSTYTLSPDALADIKCRIKMGKTSDILAVVKADGKLYTARKEVKVTIGGCGGG